MGDQRYRRGGDVLAESMGIWLRGPRLLGAAACALALLLGASMAPAAPRASATPERAAESGRGKAAKREGKGRCKGKAREKPKETRRRCKERRQRERRRRLRRRNARQKRPNVVVITTDDQNESMEGLPVTQRLLGSAGTTFSNSYVSFPLCCPSRATFLTGQYSHNHGVFSTDLPNGYNGLNHADTLPVWVRGAGYRTAMVGKYLNAYGTDDSIPEPVPDAREIPPGWAEWYALTGGLEQRRYKYKLNEQGKIHFYKRGPRNYVTDVLARKAVDFIKRQARYPKPFFLWFNPTAPHGEAGNPPIATRDPQPAPRHLGRYEYALAPRTPNFNEADVSDKPGNVAATPKLEAGEIADLDRRERGRLESLLSVDDAVKRIVGKLRKARDLRKTYIFFTSDNGLLLGSHRLRFKNFIYEESTRVPLIVRGPKFPEEPFATSSSATSTSPPRSRR